MCRPYLDAIRILRDVRKEETAAIVVVRPGEAEQPGRAAGATGADELCHAGSSGHRFSRALHSVVVDENAPAKSMGVGLYFRGVSWSEYV